MKSNHNRPWAIWLTAALTRLNWQWIVVLVFLLQAAVIGVIIFNGWLNNPAALPGDEHYQFLLLSAEALSHWRQMLVQQTSWLTLVSLVLVIVAIAAVFKARLLKLVLARVGGKVWVFGESVLAEDISHYCIGKVPVMSVQRRANSISPGLIECSESWYSTSLRPSDKVVIGNNSDADNIAVFSTKVKAQDIYPELILLNLNNVELKDSVVELSASQGHETNVVITSHIEQQVRTQLQRVKPHQRIQIDNDSLHVIVVSSGSNLDLVLRDLITRLHFPLNAHCTELSVLCSITHVPTELSSDLPFKGVNLHFHAIDSQKNLLPPKLLKQWRDQYNWPSHWFVYDDKMEVALANAARIELDCEWIGLPPQYLSVISNSPVAMAFKQKSLTSHTSLSPPFAEQIHQQLSNTFTLDELAEQNHEKYVSEQLKQGKTLGSSASLVHWSKLDESFKEDNRVFIDLKNQSLRLLGYHIGNADETFYVSEEHAQALAQAEHHRWTSVKFYQGWTYADSRSDERKCSPYIAPWTSLSAAEQDGNMRYFLGSINGGIKTPDSPPVSHYLFQPKTTLSVEDGKTALQQLAKNGAFIISDIANAMRYDLDQLDSLIVLFDMQQWDSLDPNHKAWMKRVRPNGIWMMSKGDDCWSAAEHYIKRNALISERYTGEAK